MTELVGLLQEFYRDKHGQLVQHERAARAVSAYDANNTYQYIINREDTQLTWLRSAIEELGGTVPAEPGETATTSADWPAVASLDAQAAQAFVNRWRPRVESLANARHRKMLQIILGEVLEQKRFFEQAAAGREDLLGPRDEAVGARVGRVLPARWRE
jgi:hypothetical protein